MPDAVVVGGGPAGSFSGFELPKRGVDVTVFEEHPAIGEPSHCAGHLSIRSLHNLGLYPLPDGIVENVFSGANFYSPNGTKFEVHLSQPVTCAVNRSLFDKFLSDKAQTAGAQLRMGTRVESLLIEKRTVKGVRISANREGEAEVSSKVVVDAEGISSVILRQSGLQTLKAKRLVYAVEAEVENVKDVEEHSVEVYVGKDYAPGFYGWLIPRIDGSAKVGLAVKGGNPKDYFQRLLHKHPVASKQLRSSKVKKWSFHAMTLGGPIPRAYGNGFLAVGDCASQVKPTTGGGVIFSLTCAQIAGEVCCQAIERDDVSENALQSYEKQVRDKLGFDFDVMLKARRAVDSFSDSKINRALRFAGRIGLDRALRDVEEIDFQGRALFSLLKQPAAYAVLTYLVGLYLPKNA